MATAPTVVRLPTAASRKVTQPHTPEALATMGALRAASPFCKLQEPYDPLAELSRSPELCIALAVWGALDATQRRRALGLAQAMFERTNCDASAVALRCIAELYVNTEPS